MVEAAPEAPRWDRRDVALTAVGALLCAAVGLALRLPGLRRGYSSDEVGTFLPGGPWQQFLDPETGVNPPLWRWLINARFPRAEVLAGARSMSLEASIVGIALMVVAGRLASGRWWAGWLAGLLVAVHPWAVWESPTSRVYGLWGLVFAAHLVALFAWADDTVDRRRAAAVAVTAFVLPWTHYVAVPWLAVVGIGVWLTAPSLRRLPLLYVPAALGFLPLAARILGQTGRRVPPVDPLGVSLDQVLSLGLATRALPQLAAGVPSWPLNPSLPAALVVATLAAGAVGWRGRSAGARLAWWVAMAMPVTLAVLATRQMVRPTATLMMAMALAPWLWTLPSTSSGRWQRVGATALLALGLAWPLQFMPRAFETAGRQANALREVAGIVATNRFPPGPIVLHPRGDALVLYYYLTGEHISRARPGPGCVSDEDCFELRGRTWLPRDAPAAGEAPWVLSFAHEAPELPGCEPSPAPEGAWLFRCP